MKRAKRKDLIKFYQSLYRNARDKANLYRNALVNCRLKYETLRLKKGKDEV